MNTGARRRVVGWDAILQGWRLRVWVPMWSLDFFPPIYLILSTALWALVSTQPVTEMSTRILPGSKADNLTAICEPIV
jgi:hypothetical protein